MRTTIARFAPLAAIAALTLTGCGGTADKAAETTPATTEQSDAGGSTDGQAEAADPVQASDGGDTAFEDVYDEDFAFSLTDEPLVVFPETGGKISLTMDAGTDAHEEVEWLEQYRTDAGADPVSYIVADVDNRDGTESLGADSVYVYDAAGTEYECEAPEWYVKENWQPVWLYVASDEDAYETAGGQPMEYEAGEELSRRADGYEFTKGASPLEHSSAVSICPDGLPERATGVEVWPGGIVLDPTYALPESITEMDD